jgi:hypothetical protein
MLLSKVTLYFFFKHERETMKVIPFGSNQTVPYPDEVACNLVEDVPKWQCIFLTVSVTCMSFTSLGLIKHQLQNGYQVGSSIEI